MTSSAPAPTGTPGGVVVTALLGLGAALVLLAAVPGVLRDGEGRGGASVLAALVLGLGVAALTWSLLSLRRGVVLVPRLVVVTAFGTAALGVLAYTVGQVALLAVLPAARVPGADDFSAGALLVLTAFGVTLTALRRPAEHPARPGTPGSSAATSPGPGRARTAGRLLALAAGAAVVGALVTPGLAASAAGDYAVPHGEHGLGGTATESPAPAPAAGPGTYLDPARAGRPPVPAHLGH